MDKRSWPWKKKSSDKQEIEKTLATALASTTAVSDVFATQMDKAKQANNKKSKYVQISMESYTHLTGLEDRVKSYEEKVKALEGEVTEAKEKLTEAHLETSNKEIMVKQHAKVAEEAVSGWEKAEAETLALKNNMESITLLKHIAEDRASHLEGALKECMRQIRHLKEEHEKQLHEVVLNKTKVFDKMKLELESKISILDQELLSSAAENAALSQFLQERSNMLIKLSEEKLQAEAEIEILKSDIESCEKEVNSLKYEVQIARKEVEIRNEEKNMSVQSAEVANRQQLEGVKKIAKLEAECQRLRGLVRKKLPGPAAVAQMKFEVEKMNCDHTETRLRRSPARTPRHPSQLPEFPHDSTPKFHKNYEILTERLLEIEEERNMLRESLAKCNSELSASRSLFAQTANKLQSLETHLQANDEQKDLRSNTPVLIQNFHNHNVRNPPSFTSMSEDGNDDNVSCVDSWAASVISEHLKKETKLDSQHKSDDKIHLALMDDFLEVEKLAYLSNGMFSHIHASGDSGNASSEIIEREALIEVSRNVDPLPGEDHRTVAGLADLKVQADQTIFVKFQSEIPMVFELMYNEKDMEKAIEGIRHIMQDIHKSLHHTTVNSDFETENCLGTMCDIQTLGEESMTTGTKCVSLSENGNSFTETTQAVNQELDVAISQIYDFMTVLEKEARKTPGVSSSTDELNKKLDIFIEKYGNVTESRINPIDFVLSISHVLSKASELHFNVLGFKSFELETGSSDYIDKIALPENTTAVDSSGDRCPSGCTHFSDSTSDPDVPHNGNLVPTSEITATSCKCSLEEIEQLKLEKDNFAVDLLRCTENFESCKTRLMNTEQLLSEVKSQLTSAQNANSLAETRLKCMAESYKSLETKAEDLQTKVKLLQGKIESLDNELQEERKSHQDTLTRCKDLQEQLERIDSCPKAINDDKISQEKELAAAAVKLAECQETIFLLDKQLRAMRPRTDSLNLSNSGRTQKGEFTTEDPIVSGMNLPDRDALEMDSASSFHKLEAGSESFDTLDYLMSPSRSPVSKHYKHRPTSSGSSSGSSTPTPDKQNRGLSRFFSSKGKNSK
ncbi:filament-like plant protein 6-like [Dorcoceras hygrometricum]|uniref:Filament-like plant protein 6-like n=1 Tax=Dorcoceras hygrometricum TaxID=472368 RepID=A0A2Z7BYX2_9LAMI|nr:filament-like plant protein 6-like [Dorcoceras hygrometricum]